MKYSYLFIPAVIVMAACGQRTDVNAPVASIELDSTALEKHISVLSSDEFGGRMPCTPGGEKTLAYLEQQLTSFGLEPANGESFRQAVPLVEIEANLNTTLDIQIGDMVMPLEPRTDYVAGTERPVDSIGLSASELIFCGYGIVAPEYDWNDYDGIDLKGKTAVVLVNDPGLATDDSTFFKGETMTYYGRWTYKFEEADRQGLDGILLIHESRMAGYPWFVVKTGWTGPQLLLSGKDKSQDCGVKGWIHLEKAKELFELCGQDLSTLIKASKEKGFKPVPLNASASVGFTNNLRFDTSYNIVAQKPGVKKDEHVIYTAHWDHLGIGAPVEGDSIYNGALDNASGTSTLLAVAEALGKADQMERTALFTFVTAEEQGLLGSEFYVENPLLPLSKAVANINIDGINMIGLSKDLTVTGYGQSELDELAEKYATEQGRYVQGEQEPEKGYFFRSDHFNFAKKGVPALYAKGGLEHMTKGKEYAKKVRESFIENQYHQPSDEYDPAKWNLSGAVQDGQLLFDLSLELLSTDQWPRWKEGSEFKSLDPRK